MEKIGLWNASAEVRMTLGAGGGGGSSSSGGGIGKIIVLPATALLAIAMICPDRTRTWWRGGMRCGRGRGAD